MLKTLTVWNFALLEHVQVEFGEGLNILTGETGAGKSILIDSLGAVLGKRVTGDMIRTGCDCLRVEAVFTLGEEDREQRGFLQEQAIDVEEDQLIITRQVAHSGRGMVLVNGSHVTLAVLKQLGALLLDVHGQNENLALLREESQFHLLDSYDAAIGEIHEEYLQRYRKWHALQKAYEEKQLAAREYAQRQDMLRWQDREITEARLREHEDEELEAEIRKLSHAEKIAGYVEDSCNLFDGSSKTGIGLLPALAQIKKNLEDMSRYDESLANALQIVQEAEVSLQEASYEAHDYADDMDFSPDRLNKLQSRMDVIDKLCRKYGENVAEVLAHQQKVKQELESIENYDGDMAELQKEIDASRKAMLAKAAELTGQREKAAEALGRSVAAQLHELGMPQASLHIKVSPAEKCTPGGADVVEMFFSANAGEAEKPLQKVASGGELSRLALAIKTVAASRDKSVPSMVFDEIDTGIGGRTAQMVAERIALVARYKQVLCITHLPQIACMADQHLYIAKSSVGESTMTHIRALTEAERVREIARMASGADATAASLDNAREMVSHARLKKQQLQVK